MLVGKLKTWWGKGQELLEIFCPAPLCGRGGSVMLRRTTLAAGPLLTFLWPRMLPLLCLDITIGFCLECISTIRKI